eukprot:CAMPEP_0119033086 /NCGR_PEP_ID=MMETSP1177-20130426/80_1 /TAXON_ID=2985 /ORGANISM="Ochromonas sp, Strain CCMP1899" /LENGTH=398 /DNA_ID=CAMNT_0006989543 /DNA_START=133 /DNA_END=1329 /DNA_ORIENTATION=-
MVEELMKENKADNKEMEMTLVHWERKFNDLEKFLIHLEEKLIQNAEDLKFLNDEYMKREMTHAEKERTLAEKARVTEDRMSYHFERMNENSQENCSAIQEMKKAMPLILTSITTLQKRMNVSEKALIEVGVIRMNRDPVEETQKISSEKEKEETQESPELSRVQKELTWSEVLNKNTKKNRTIASSNPGVQKGNQLPEQAKVQIAHQVMKSPPKNTYIEGAKKDVLLSTDLSSICFKKPRIALEKGKKQEIVSWYLSANFNDRFANLARITAGKVILDIVGKTPLAISAISPTVVQILFNKEDEDSFLKILKSPNIKLIENKERKFNQREITRLAHLYLSSYYKELAHVTLLGVPAAIISQILLRGEELVQMRFPNPLKQRKALLNIKRDQKYFQPVK